jgi:hypothetical protein
LLTTTSWFYVLNDKPPHMLRGARNTELGEKRPCRSVDVSNWRGQQLGALKQVAEWLAQNAENANLVARLDADHFSVVLPKVMYEAADFGTGFSSLNYLTNCTLSNSGGGIWDHQE